MNVKALLILPVLMITLMLQAQRPMVVTEQDIKLTGTEKLYFAFAEGDDITVEIEMERGKPLKSVAFVKKSGQIPFSDSKVETLNKTIHINETDVYHFEIQSGGLGLRAKIAKIKITRTPASEDMASFKTQVKWVTMYDSTYVTRYRKNVIGQDTLYRQMYESNIILGQPQPTVENANQMTQAIDIPQFVESELENYRLIGIAYYMGQGSAGLSAYLNESQRFREVGKCGDFLQQAAAGAFTLTNQAPAGTTFTYLVKGNIGGIARRIDSGNSAGKFGVINGTTLAGLKQLQIQYTNNSPLPLPIMSHFTSAFEHTIYEKEAYEELVVTQREEAFVDQGE